MADRRSLLRGLAAMPLVGLVPAAVQAGATSPDAALFDLIGRHAAAQAARDAHEDARDAAEDRYAAATPHPSDVLLLRRGDAFGVCRFMEHTGDGRGVGGLWFSANAVHALRTMTPPAHLAERHAEVVAAFDAWDDEVDALYDRTGMKAADEEDDRLFSAVALAEQAVLDAVPVALDGFQAKARWMMARGGWEKHAAVMVRDLCGAGAPA